MEGRRFGILENKGVFILQCGISTGVTDVWPHQTLVRSLPPRRCTHTRWLLTCMLCWDMQSTHLFTDFYQHFLISAKPSRRRCCSLLLFTGEVNTSGHLPGSHASKLLVSVNKSNHSSIIWCQQTKGQSACMQAEPLSAVLPLVAPQNPQLLIVISLMAERLSLWGASEAQPSRATGRSGYSAKDCGGIMPSTLCEPSLGMRASEGCRAIET